MKTSKQVYYFMTKNEKKIYFKLPKCLGDSPPNESFCLADKVIQNPVSCIEEEETSLWYYCWYEVPKQNQIHVDSVSSQC